MKERWTEEMKGEINNEGRKKGREQEGRERVEGRKGGGRRVEGWGKGRKGGKKIRRLGLRAVFVALEPIECI